MIPNHIGFIVANNGLTLIKNSPIDIPPSVTWLKASAISDNLLTTINAPIKGAINPTKIPLINEYLIKSKFKTHQSLYNTPSIRSINLSLVSTDISNLLI